MQPGERKPHGGLHTSASTGEVVGVAALLNDIDQLNRMNETLQTA
jgi:hypothetical protein